MSGRVKLVLIGLACLLSCPAAPAIEINFRASGPVSGGGSNSDASVSFGGLGFVRAKIDFNKSTGKGTGPLSLSAGGSYNYLDRITGMSTNGGWSVSNQPGEARAPIEFGFGELVSIGFLVNTSAGPLITSGAASFDFLSKKALSSGSGSFGGVPVSYSWNADLDLPDLLEPITRDSLYPEPSGGEMRIVFRPNFGLSVAEMKEYTMVSEVNFISWIVDTDVKRGVFTDRSNPPKDLRDLLEAGPVEDPPKGGWNYQAQDNLSGYYDSSEIPGTSSDSNVVFSDAPNLGAGNGTFVRFRTALLVRRNGVDITAGNVVEWEWRAGQVMAPSQGALKLSVPGAPPAGESVVLASFPNNLLGPADRAFLQSAGVQPLFVPVAGDYNKDGLVDAADYTVWRDSLGATGIDLPADGDGDFTIGAGDYNLWKASFAAPALAFTQVPESSSLVLLAATVGSLWSMRRNRFHSGSRS